MRFASSRGPLGEFRVKLEKSKLIKMPSKVKNTGQKYENCLKAIEYLKKQNKRDSEVVQASGQAALLTHKLPIPNTEDYERSKSL
jgi:hypothetical protein